MGGRGVRGLPRVVWLLGFASLLNDVSSEAVFPLLPLFLAQLGGGARALGVVEGVADAVAAATRIVAGRISDRGPRRLLVVGGYTLPAAARAGIAAALAPLHVLAARVVDRLGKGIRSAPRDALLADAAGVGDRGRAFGLQRSMDHLGAAIGPLLAAGLVAVGASLRATFLLAAVIGLAAPILLALRLRDSPRPRAAGSRSPGLEPAEDGPEGPGRVSPADEGAAPARGRLAGGRAGLPRPLRGYLALAALFSLGNSTDAFLLLRARDVGVPAAGVPLLWFLHHVLKTATGLPGGALSDRVPRGAVVAAGWAAYALAYVGFAFSAAPWQIVLLFAFYSLYHGLAEGAERALVADLAPRAQLGRAFGWYHGGVGFAALPASVLTGALWGAFGPRVALGVAAAFAGAAAALLAASPLARGRRSAA